MINDKDYVKVPRDDDDDDDDRDDDVDADVTVIGDEVVNDAELRRRKRRVNRSLSDPMPDIDALLAEYADTGRYVLLERWENSAWTFLDKIDVPDASLVAIKTRFGGGKFRMRIIGDDPTKQRQITYRIAGRARGGDDEPGTNASGDAETIAELRARLEAIESKATTKNGNGDNTTTEILKLVVAAALRPAPVPVVPARDPLMADLISALIKGDRPNSPGIDPLKLQELLQKARQEGYENGKQLGEALAAAVGEGDGVARVLATTLPSVVEAFKDANKNYRANPPRVPAPVTPRAIPNVPAGESGSPITEDASVGVSNGPAWISALRPAVPMLVGWARAGKDAAIKAANTVDDLNDTVREQIAIQAEEPNFVHSVLTAIPEFQAPDVEPWIILFLSTIQEMLTTDDAEGLQPGAEIAEA